MDDKEILEERQKIISNLTATRLEKGLSQKELAAIIGTQKSNISRIESGSQNITIDMFLKMSKALGKHVAVELRDRETDIFSDEIYSIRLYDTELIRFSMKYDRKKGIITHIISVNSEMKDLFPLDLDISDEGIADWLRKRVIPKNRAFVGMILKSFGLESNDTKGIIDVCLGLSLNDSYWVVKSDFNGRFKEYNLYENPFAEALALVAYTGEPYDTRIVSTSPEFTTHGVLRKAWRCIDGEGIVLYKGGTEGAANAGYEPYSEYYACQIAERMGLDAVHYELENWKGILASKCRLFTDIDTSYVPIGHIVKTGGLQAVIDYCGSLGEQIQDNLKSMLVFDAVIYNEDRHFDNFGLLRDNKTGVIKGMAPIFDNGMSLFNYGMREDFYNLKEYAETRTNPYGISYDDICRQYMGIHQRQQLRRLIGFKFKRHESINLPEYRLSAIEQQIGYRVRELLSLPRIRTENELDYDR